MKSIVIALISGICALTATAQKAPIKFGDIRIEDLKMTSYAKDSSASAVVLTDFGESAITYNQSSGFSLGFERHTRIKILKKDGFEWADFSISLYHDGNNAEKMSGLKAVTYNLEGGKIVESKLKNDGIFREKYSENTNITKFTLPNVKEGSVIEITYKIASDFLFNFQDWKFQYTIPVIWSEYRAAIPEFYNYDKYMQGYIGLAINDEKTISNSITITSTERSTGTWNVKTTLSSNRIDFMEKQFRWVAQDVPGFKEEPFMTSADDYVSQMNFELSYIQFPNQPRQQIMGSWQEINSKFAERSDFGGEITGNGFLKKTVEQIIAGKETDEAKISAINSYVKSNVTWDGSSRKYTDGSLKKVLEDKKGNSAEINLLLGSMLEKAGFKVNPVLISTRDHGVIRQNIPISSQFNYVLCQVQFGDKQIILDGTDALLPTGVLPERCLNEHGFVISTEGHRWVSLRPSVKSRTFVKADLKLIENGEMKCVLDLSRTGYHAQRVRKKYFLKGEQEYVKDFVSSKSWLVNKSEFGNTKELNESFKEKHDLTINEHATASGGIIYLNPFVMLREEENPFRLETRSYPVDFGSTMEKIYVCQLTIPEGFAVDEMPKSLVFMLPENAARFSYNVSLAGDVLSITSSFQINKNIFVQDEYPNLREFYNKVIAKQGEQIVLKKK